MSTRTRASTIDRPAGGKASATPTAQATSRTLNVPGAVLVYDVRRNHDSTEPVLLLIGSPMGAAGFGTLSRHFADRTVVTYDPRGTERSVKTDPDSNVTPEIHADDLHRLIAAIGGEPVELFASSGGAVNALALVARHPEDVRTLVAHEPPLGSVLPDREHALSAARAIHETYQRRGWGAAMAHFIAITSHKGPFTAEIAGRPAPDPAMFGLPSEDDGKRTDPMLGHAVIVTTHYEPDIDALLSAATRIVMAAGAESEGQMTSRAAHAIAERLGTSVVIFPSGHAGFLGGEYGQTGEPDAFAAKLREVLEQRSGQRDQAGGTPTTTDRARLPGKFVWFEHASNDARKAQSFYEEVLGWKLQPWGDGYDMILAGDTVDTMIGGYTSLEDGREKPHWISYVSVEDVDAATRKAETNGGRILEAPHDLPGAGRVARIADPQGAELCLFRKEGCDPPDGPASEPPALRRFFWCELHTTEPANAVSFYEQVIGYTHESMDMGSVDAYHILSSRGAGRAGVTGHLSNGICGGAPHWLPYVAVDDPDATLARATKHGGKVHVGPHDIPGVGRFGVLEDPSGAVLAVMKAIPPK